MESSICLADDGAARKRLSAIGGGPIWLDASPKMLVAKLRAAQTMF
jgi:hypothetical protein